MKEDVVVYTEDVLDPKAKEILHGTFQSTEPSTVNQGQDPGHEGDAPKSEEAEDTEGLSTEDTEEDLDEDDLDEDEDEEDAE